jgi:hypothetical protein
MGGFGAILIPCLLWEAVFEAHPLSPMRLAVLCRLDGESSVRPEAVKSCRCMKKLVCLDLLDLATAHARSYPWQRQFIIVGRDQS